MGGYSPQSSCDELERVLKSFLRVQRSQIICELLFIKVMLHMHAVFTTLAMSPESLEDSKCLQVHTVGSLVIT